MIERVRPLHILFLVVVWFALFAFVSGLIASLVKVNSQLRIDKSEHGLWTGSRLQSSYQEVEKAISAYRLSPDAKTREELHLKLDLLWSSASVYDEHASGMFQEAFMRHRVIFEKLSLFLTQLDTALEEQADNVVLANQLVAIQKELSAFLPQITVVQRHILQNEVPKRQDLIIKQQQIIQDALWGVFVWGVLSIFIGAILFFKFRRAAKASSFLESQNHRFRGALENAAFGVSIRSQNGDVLYENEMIRRLDGLGQRRAKGLIDFGPKFGPLERYSYPLDGVALGQDLSLENDISMHIRMDISQLEAKINRLSLALDDHENAAAAKSDFLATMSHEMRTPLNGVLGLLGLVLDGELEAEQRGYVMTARESGEILLTLIEDILDYSKIEAGKLEFEETEFSIDDLVSSVCDMLAPKAHEKNIDIGWHVDSSVPQILKGDPGRLRQVLLNLAGNAVKFTEEGGVTVEISLSSDMGGELIVSGLVSDTGIGIPYEAQDAMFGEFSQMDASFSRRFGGTGLGLAITRRLVEAMGGTIRVSSEPDNGSQFSFSVKMRKASVAEGENDRVLTKAARRILYFAPRGLNTDLFLRNVQAMGHQITAAYPESELLNTIAISQPELIILDVHNDDNGVVALAQHLHTERPDIPIVVLGTTQENEFNQHLVQPEIIKTCIAKPIHQGRLYTLLEDIQNIGKNDQRKNTSDRQSHVGEGHRILLVEDSPTNRMVVSAVLRRVGYHVDWALDGVEAVESVQKFPYDVILMDISMPNMDGMEATRHIRALAGSENAIPIIALTAHAMPGDRERFLAAGMDDYLVKPLEAAALLSMIAANITQVKPKKANNRRSKPGTKQATEITILAEEEDVIEAVSHSYEEVNLLDMAVLEQLEEDAGRETIPYLMSVFKEEVPTSVKDVKENLERRNLDILARTAHTLKSSSGSFGATRLNQIAYDIEMAAKAGQFGAIETRLKILEETAETTLNAYDGYLDGL